MIRFVIYKNSILATICSMCGAASVAMAVMGLMGKEIGIFPAIILIAVGLGLMWLAAAISEKKEQRKKEKAAQKAAAGTTYTQPQQTTAGAAYARPQTAAAAGSHAGAAQPRQAGQATPAFDAYVKAATVGSRKPVKASPVFAAIFFILASLLGLWSQYIYSLRDVWSTLGADAFIVFGMGVLLMIAAFRTRHIQEVSVLFALGFLGLAVDSAYAAVTAYRVYGFGEHITNNGIYYAIPSVPMIETAVYFLMAVFAVLSGRKIKEHMGGVVRWLGWIPFVALAVACMKDIGDSRVLDLLDMSMARGFEYPPRPEFLQALSQIFMVLAVLFTGACFRRICKKPVRQTSYVQPEMPAQPQYQQPVQQPAQPQYQQPVQQPAQPQYQQPVQQPAQPQYQQPVQQPAQPQYQQPVQQPVQSRPANSPDLEKTIKAYKDLLECGILSQEEYEEKIRELKRG